MAKLTRKQIAWRVAQDIPEGAYVNLGIGAPEMVANYLPEDREVIIHSENGLLGMGPTPPPPGQENPDLINAGKKPGHAGRWRQHLASHRLLRHDPRRPYRYMRAWCAFQVAQNWRPRQLGDSGQLPPARRWRRDGSRRWGQECICDYRSLHKGRPAEAPGTNAATRSPEAALLPASIRTTP